MIFGFNTDVRHGDAVYHVQSETRDSELLLQTQVFLQGRCIGKRALSYADAAGDAGISEHRMHESLKEQHRMIVEAVRAGQFHSVLQDPEAADGEGLGVEWINPDSAQQENAWVFHFRVTSEGAAVAGARVTSRFVAGETGPVYAQSLTADDGTAEVRLALPNASLGGASLTVQATHAGRCLSRRFRIQP